MSVGKAYLRAENKKQYHIKIYYPREDVKEYIADNWYHDSVNVICIVTGCTSHYISVFNFKEIEISLINKEENI